MFVKKVLVSEPDFGSALTCDIFADCKFSGENGSSQSSKVFKTCKNFVVCLHVEKVAHKKVVPIDNRQYKILFKLLPNQYWYCEENIEATHT